MAKKVFQVGDEPLYSKVDKVHVMNPTEGGGGVADKVAWEYVTDKPTMFPPSEHNHDERYYTKTEIDGPGFMSNRIDNVTIELAGRELKVRSMDGLVIGVAQINEWLAGTSGNIQTQIDGINDSLSALTSGMKYLGKIERYADLQTVGNKENGNLVVVLADESRSGGRSMYVYSDEKGSWEFIGEFTFTDAFLALKDTPTSYAGADGKVVKVAGERLVFDDVDYADLTNKPASTITQIDSAVEQAHVHANKQSLDKLGVNESGELTINGVVYTPKSTQQPKQRLYARRTGTEQPLTTGTTCVFNTKYVGEGIPYDTDSGVFTLEAGKTYRVFVTASINTEGFVLLRLVTASNNAVTADNNQAIWMSVNPSNTSWKESSTGPLLAYVTPTTTQGFKIRASSVNGASGLRPNHCALEIVEI